MPKFIIGPVCDPARIQEMQTRDAVLCATQTPGAGLIWQLNANRRHWAIVGNYSNGRAWNGRAQIVAADPGDWDYLCRESM